MQRESKPKVLFLCTGNSCRSQMAEGWAKHLLARRIEPASAGVSPGTLNPLAVQVMEEEGVDISHHRSRDIRELLGSPFDYVITVCDRARESCPVFPGRARVIHIPFDDPPALAASATSEAEALPHYRRVRDEIRDFVERLPEFLDRLRGKEPRELASPGSDPG